MKLKTKTAKNIYKYFYKLRFKRNFHLGLGDIRLTLGMQDEIIQMIDKNCKDKILKKTK